MGTFKRRPPAVKFPNPVFNVICDRYWLGWSFERNRAVGEIDITFMWFHLTIWTRR